jgi:sugar-specific transcriptional regulator TrmB
MFKALMSLGLSQIDARVYIFLALTGPKKALNIVDNLKINKQQIIRSLKYLQNNGVIAPDTETQDAFTALPFEEALESLIKKEKKQTQNLEETKETLLSNWRTMIKKKQI